MKRLRVLTGIHAGVSVVLGVGRVRVGRDSQSDILISDWTEADVMLIVPQEGPVLAHAVSDAGDTGGAADSLALPPAGDDPARPLPDYAAQRHGEVVFCIGPDDEPWPPDVTLLQALYGAGPASARRSPSRWRTPALVGVGALACGLAAVCALLLMSETGHALAVPPAQDAKARQLLATRLQAEFDHQGWTDLHVRTQAGRLQVHGYVPNLAADARVRDVLRTLGATEAERRYRDAGGDAQALRQMLAQHDIKVSYTGEGRFHLAGKVASLPAFEDALTRARGELGNPEVRITTDITQKPDRAPALAYVNVFATDNLRVARTPDGTRHVFSATSPAETAGQPDAPASPSLGTPASPPPAAPAAAAATPAIHVLSPDADIPPAVAAATAAQAAPPPRQTEARPAAAPATAKPTRRKARATYVPPRPPFPEDGRYVGLPSMSGAP
ncbi:Type III secretion inner membrane protein (YscD,homologous to flagellar export components) [plant metagenome]|uniref:Type III secretion inner membrane protein (YscD,homologous to flagellar export components) n=1 Tax=plant metagenome TaxID=1297885 RepID=A0A484VE12_9ZZZZ